MANRDARTAEQQAAAVKCRFCEFALPRYRKSDGQERRDIWETLRDHVKSKHRDETAGAQLIAGSAADLARHRARMREAWRINGWDDEWGGEDA